MQTTGTLSTSVLKKAIDRYYKELQEYKGRADYELATRTAFLNLLAESARHVKWLLIPEQSLEGGIRPDGVLRDSFDLKRGIWEAKGAQGKPLVATAHLYSQVSLAALLEIWNGYVEWRTYIMPTLPEADQMFATTMNGDKIWLLEDGAAFTILYPEDY